MKSVHCSAISIDTAFLSPLDRRPEESRNHAAPTVPQPIPPWLRFAKILACVLPLIAPLFTHAAPLALSDNLASAGTEALSARRPIMLFFTQPGCVFCERARRQYISPLASTAEWSARTLSVEVSRMQKLRGFDGQETTGAEIARRYGVRVYPTVVFVNSKGVALAAAIEGFTVPDFYGAYLEERLQAASARFNGD